MRVRYITRIAFSRFSSDQQSPAIAVINLTSSVLLICRNQIGAKFWEVCLIAMPCGRGGVVFR